jgi:hypothetical protein
MLHPKSEARGMGIPGKKANPSPTRPRSPRTTKPLLERARPAGLFPHPPGIFSGSSGTSKRSTASASTSIAGKRWASSANRLRQDHHRPGHPAAGRTDRRQRRLRRPRLRALTGRAPAQCGAADADHLPGSLRLAEPADDRRVDAHRADEDPRHRQLATPSAATAPPRCSKKSASRPSTCGAIRTNSPAASGSASASPGPGGRAGVHHLRRIGLRARRLGAGAGAEPAQGRCRPSRGLTYIFISHDLSVVKFMADMMAVMNDGKIVEFGPSEAIYPGP